MCYAIYVYARSAKVRVESKEETLQDTPNGDSYWNLLFIERVSVAVEQEAEEERYGMSVRGHVFSQTRRLGREIVGKTNMRREERSSGFFLSDEEAMVDAVSQCSM